MEHRGMTDLLLRGRAWVYPDNVAIDGDIMALEFALKRETRPDFLKDYVFAGLDPDFPKRARPGDIVVGGRRFAQGNPHIQGMIGLKGCGVGLVAESIPIGSFRNALAAGLPGPTFQSKTSLARAAAAMSTPSTVRATATCAPRRAGIGVGAWLESCISGIYLSTTDVGIGPLISDGSRSDRVGEEYSVPSSGELLITCRSRAPTPIRR